MIDLVVQDHAGVPGVTLVQHRRHADARGYFEERYTFDTFQRLTGEDWYRPAMQINRSRSGCDVVRGLHFQWGPPMGKLMGVTKGAAFLVSVNLDATSEAFGRVHTITLTEDMPVQVWAPAWYARGVAALTNQVDVQYVCTAEYSAPGEGAIRWNDPTLAIPWPPFISGPYLSPKDQEAPLWKQWVPHLKAWDWVHGYPARTMTRP